MRGHLRPRHDTVTKSMGRRIGREVAKVVAVDPGPSFLALYVLARRRCRRIGRGLPLWIRYEMVCLLAFSGSLSQPDPCKSRAHARARSLR